jgi:small subunit ribosomal protein S8
MNINDPIGDMITRIRNAHMRGKELVDSPSSALRVNVLEVLKEEGFIRGYSESERDTGQSEVQIELKYHEGDPVIKEIIRVSKPALYLQYHLKLLLLKMQHLLNSTQIPYI